MRTRAASSSPSPPHSPPPRCSRASPAMRSARRRRASSAWRCADSAASRPTRSRRRCSRRATAGWPASSPARPSKAEEWKKKYGLPGQERLRLRDHARMADEQGHRHRLRRDAERAAPASTRSRPRPPANTCSARSRWRSRVERCQQMVDACKKAGKMLGVGYRCQFEPNHLECVRLATREGARRRQDHRRELRLRDGRSERSGA